MRFWLGLIAASLIVSCNSAAEPEPMAPPEISAISEPSIAEDGVTFEDLLAQYQALNQRLEEVSYNIQGANAELCPVTDRTAGLTVHSIFDYPESLQPYARALLQVNEALSIRTIRAGSSAHDAGLKPADHLVKIGGSYLPSGLTAKTLYEALSRRALSQDSVDISVRRGGDIITQSLTPETICGYPVNLFFSERINGHTDGKEVWITSELMRSLPDDTDLALVIAHEMAHAIDGHMEVEPSKALELKADKMALIMLARAGYDIGQAVENWARAPHPDDETRPSSTHPTQAERLAHFSAVQSDIEARLKAEQDLNFND